MAAIDLARGVTFAALDPALLIATMSLVGVLLVGAVVIAFVRRWQQLQRRSSLSPSASDQLAQFRALHEQGRISEEEFRRLRAVLSEEIRKENDLPMPAPAAPAPQPSPAIQAAPPAPAPAPPPEGPKEPPPETGIRPA
jgi:hypothetical protein